MPHKATGGSEPLRKKIKSGGDKPKAISQTVFRRLEETEKRIYEAALDSGSTLAFAALQDAAGVRDANAFLESTNALVRKHLLTMHTVGNEPVLKAVPLAQAKATGSLEEEVRIVLQVINDAADLGIWKRVIKGKTQLHAKTLNNCLRELEGRKLVKTVRGVKYPTRKLYMAYDLQPSVELTGGPWYTDERELDSEFIEKLLQMCEKYIEKNSCVGGDRRNETMYPKAYWPFMPTLWHVRQFITENKILTGTTLTDSDYQNLLNILVADGKIEAIPIQRDFKDIWQADSESKRSLGRSGQTQARRKKRKRGAVDNEDDSEDIDEEDSDEDESDEDIALTPPTDYSDPNVRRAGPPGSDDYVVYRTVHCFTRTEDEAPVPLGVMSGLLDGPCGVCPVRQYCDNAGRPRPKRVSAFSRFHRPRRDPLALVIPSASDIGHGPGGDDVWRGGGTRGVATKGHVNPEDCAYFDQWLAIAANVPPPSAYTPDWLTDYERNPYEW